LLAAGLHRLLYREEDAGLAREAQQAGETAHAARSLAVPAGWPHVMPNWR
jgi:hypothetical protein